MLWLRWKQKLLHLVWRNLPKLFHQRWRQAAAPMDANETGNFKKNFILKRWSTQAQLEKFSAFGLNISSLKFDKHELKLFLDTLEQKPGGLALTETWVAENDSIEKYNFDGYQTVEYIPRLNCSRRYGGVAFYIMDGII